MYIPNLQAAERTAIEAVVKACNLALGPGPHVSGGPVPKPGERTEADYLREVSAA